MEKISLIDFKALTVNLEANKDSKENIVSLNTNASYSDENDKLLIFKFEMKLSSEEGFSMHVDYVGYFESDDPITDDFKDGLFVKVAAPSILFPYLRSFVSNLSVNAGLTPVVLPVMNFHAIAKAKEEESKE